MVYKLLQKALLVSAVAVVVCGHPVVAQDTPSPRILVLHAYHQGYRWTDDLSSGIKQYLSETYPRPELFLEYLDAIRTDQESSQQAIDEFFRVKYRDISLDGIIATDDGALSFLERYYADLFEGVPVVFCGVGTYDPSAFGQDSTYVTGLTSPWQNIVVTIELALSLQENVTQFYIIRDANSRSDWFSDALQNIRQTHPTVRFEEVDGNELTTDEMLAVLSGAPEHAAALLITWQRDRTGQYYGISESTQLISEHASVPLYGLGYHRLGHGIVGGMLISGSIQGGAVAQVLAEVLSGTPPSAIPVQPLELNEYYFDYAQLKRWNINEDELPEQSHVLFRPFSFYHEYFGLVWGASVVFFFLVGLIAVLIIEIRQRQRIQRREVEQKNILVSVLSHIPHLVYWKNLDLVHTGCNQRYADAAGVDYPSQLIGLTDSAILWKRDAAERLEAAERNVLRSGAPVFDESESELCMYDKPATLLKSIIPMRDISGNVMGILGIYSDVTESKRLEEQFIQAQKMETVGRLAGGVAHDFNNLLTVIIGNAEIALMEMNESHDLHQEVKEIHTTANRAAELTRQLLGFSRRQMIRRSVVDINAMIFGIEKMLRRLIGEDIELVILPCAGCWPVYVDPGQIEQILANLIVNARDAMPGGGTITIETEKRTAVGDDEHGLSGDFVVVQVTDTGEGMDADTANKAFEPFFTTKEKGKGTGLGLSTCYGIVQQNGGQIAIDSIPGTGTTITLYLPRSKEQETRTDSGHPLPDIAGGSETILLVEDEPSLNKMIQRILHEQGYRVLVAFNGDEALSILSRTDGCPVQLLITDIIMPRIGGRELVERVHVFAPDMNVLYMSGYTGRNVISERMDGVHADFIQKPFATGDFLKKVRRMLDARTDEHDRQMGSDK